MERVYWTKHNGMDILIDDFSNIKPGDEFQVLLNKARKEIHSRPEKSVLALFDATVVGIQGLLKVAMQTVNIAARRLFMLVNTREEGLDWLAEQTEKGGK